jgi:HlyD family secretion protein
LFVVPIVLLGLGLARSSSQNGGEVFTWSKVSRGSIVETITSTGEVQPKRKINVGTTALGEIKKLHVRENDVVAPGDILATIDQGRLNQELNRVEAGLAAAASEQEKSAANRAEAEETFARNKQLREMGLISSDVFRKIQLDRQTAEFSYRTAIANVNQNKALVSATRKLISDAVVKAPIAGRVTSIKAEEGENAIPGSSNLPGATIMVLSDMSELFAEIKLNESEVTRVRPGQEAEIVLEALPGLPLKGVVKEILSSGQRVDQESNQYRVRILMDVPEAVLPKILPGMAARVAVLVYTNPRALRVPIQAVLERDKTEGGAPQPLRLIPEKQNVVLVASKGTLQQRVVELGHVGTQFYEVLGGLDEGTVVLTGPIRGLKEARNGMAITLRQKKDGE